MDNAENSPAPFTVFGPARQSAPVVFASPHSGQYYPDDLMASTTLPELLLRRTADNFVDELFAAAPDHGTPDRQTAIANDYRPNDRHETDQKELN